MADVLTDREAPESDYDVLQWRFDCLTSAGYPTDVALMLAAKRSVDLHLACGLLKRGATIHEALRILT